MTGREGNGRFPGNRPARDGTVTPIALMQQQESFPG